MARTINPETNLPTLPDGYWWSVSHAEQEYYDKLVVSIRCKREKLSYWRQKPTGKFIDRDYAFATLDWRKFRRSETPEDQIRILAHSVLTEAELLWRAAANVDRVNNLMGEYPPKKLEVFNG